MTRRKGQVVDAELDVAPADLLGPVPVPPKKEQAPKPDVARCIETYELTFEARHGCKPPRPKGGYGRFGADVKPLIEAWGVEEVLSLIDEFFYTRDPMVLRTDWKPEDFTRLAQRLKLRRTGSHCGTSDAVTNHNMDVAARVTRPRQQDGAGAARLPRGGDKR